MTGQLSVLKGEIAIQRRESDLATERARLAESARQLDNDEIDRLNGDLARIQEVHAADTEHMCQLTVKYRVRSAVDSARGILCRTTM
jgi:hypothetical protein